MNEKWVVFGRENVQYDHVGSPRFRCEEFWGEGYATREACQAACQRRFRQEFPRFLLLYPRKESERPEFAEVVNAEF